MFLINRIIMVALKLLVKISNRFLKPFGVQISFDYTIRMFKKIVVERFAFIVDKFYLAIGKRCVFVVLAGPPAIGKNTVLHFLMKEMEKVGENLHFIKSNTTRNKRANKIDKDSYNFVSDDFFKSRIAKNQMFECVMNMNNNQYYGFTLADIRNVLLFRKNSVVVVDYRFLIKLQKYLKKNKIKYCDIISVYLKPRSIDVIKNRIYERSTESKSEINRRIKSVREDMKTAKYYEFEIVNDESFNSAILIKEIILNKLRTKNKKKI
ncbi:MAG: hypothetical protein LBU68_01090 [Rickettsiales bacterium]|jgi:guanylate kinase|nr:hypothetical protein [Rickettsiales bacterium]